MAKRARSRGSYELAKLGLTQDEIAERLGCKRPQVTWWLSGERRPNERRRAQIFAVYGIKPEWWDEPQLSAALPVRHGGSSSSATVKDRAERMLRMLDHVLEEVENDTSSTPLEKIRTMQRATPTIQGLGKLTGEAQEMSEHKIIRLPAWRRIEETIATALTPWPKAARAVAEALQQLEESSVR